MGVFEVDDDVLAERPVGLDHTDVNRGFFLGSRVWVLKKDIDRLILVAQTPWVPRNHLHPVLNDNFLMPSAGSGAATRVRRPA